jgi:hypothetical protein
LETEMAKTPWRPIKTFRRETSQFDEAKQVDLWIRIHASPMSMGLSDSFRVTGCWQDRGTWFHYHEGKVKELTKHYITHWMPVPPAPKLS